MDAEPPPHQVEVHSLMPGLVNAFAATGLAGGNAEITSEITPDFSALSTIDWLSRDFEEARSAGVTTVQVLPATENVFAGMACVIKTAGPIERACSFARSCGCHGGEQRSHLAQSLTVAPRQYLRASADESYGGGVDRPERICNKPCSPGERG